MCNLFLAWSWTACNDGNFLSLALSIFFLSQLISLIKVKRCDVDVLDVSIEKQVLE